MADTFLNALVGDGQPFSLVNMTTALVEKAHVGNEMSLVLPWSTVYSKTTWMAVDRKTKGIHLVGTVARGAKLPQFVPFDRSIYQLPIPRTGERGEVSVDEILDKRRFGSNDLEDMGELRDERIGDTKDALMNTDNLAKGLALRGIMADAVTGKQIYDLKAERGVTQIAAYWDLTTCNPNELLSVMKEALIDKMGDATIPYDGWELLVGRSAYRALRQNQHVIKNYETYQAVIAVAQERFGATDVKVPGGFRLSDDVTVRKMGRDRYDVIDQNPASPTFGQKLGTQGVIPDWAMFLCPRAPGMYQTAFAPSSKAQFINTVQPYYVVPRVKDDDTGIEWEVDTFRANIVSRPELIAEIFVTKGLDASGNAVNGYDVNGNLVAPLAA